MPSFTVKLPNTGHEIEVEVSGLHWTGNGWDEPRELEYDDVSFTWARTGREVKQSGLIELIDGLWDLGQAQEAAEDDFNEPEPYYYDGE